ncbi:hypothetical protein K438DRAFT_1978406 [Mycena galopus ATCC 62051]|nr:hypothetical protein K438DRAFT_1978406 [Mycena galopus ATCC 62051]
MPPQQLPDQLWVEEYSKDIKYSSGWTREYGTVYHESAVMRTTELGASLSFEFWGTGIKLIGAEGWDHSTFVVTLDGENTNVDGACCFPNGTFPLYAIVPQVTQFEASDLNDAKHVLTVTNASPGLQGTVLELDALVITLAPQTIESAPLPAVVEKNSDSDFFWFIFFVFTFYYFFLRKGNAPATVTVQVSAAPVAPAQLQATQQRAAPAATGSTPNRPTATAQSVIAQSAPYPGAPAAANSSSFPAANTNAGAVLGLALTASANASQVSAPANNADVDEGRPLAAGADDAHPDPLPPASASKADAKGSVEVLFTSDGRGGSGEESEDAPASSDDSDAPNDAESARLLGELEEDEGFYHVGGP